MLACMRSQRKFRLAALAPLVGLALTDCATQKTPPPQTTPAAPSASGLSLDTPIGEIDAAPGGRAVLDQDLPGLTSRPEYPIIKTMSLKTLAGLSGGKLTRDRLTQVQSDLARLPPAGPASGSEPQGVSSAQPSPVQSSPEGAAPEPVSPQPDSPPH